MKELLNYILKEILDKTEFEINEREEDGKTIFTIIVDPESIGLVIGKGGLTIKAIQNLLRVRARLENKMVYLNVEPSG